MEEVSKYAVQLQEREHEVTQQLATTAGSVVSLKAQAAAAAAETSALQRELQSVKQDYRVMSLKLEDKVGHCLRLSNYFVVCCELYVFGCTAYYHWVETHACMHGQAWQATRLVSAPVKVSRQHVAIWAASFF